MMNNIYKKFILYVVFFMLPAPIWAEMNKDNIKLVTGLSKPPYVNQRDDSGLQLDLIREAFLTEGIETNFTYMPQSRNITGYKKWSVDGVITVPVNFQYEGMYLSKPYIRYQNVAISLAQRNFVLNRVRDLSGKSIVAFQNARKYLGQDYAKVVAYSLDYREVAEQRKQVDMLFSGDTEVIVMDVNIFKHFFSLWKKYNDPNDIIIHEIFSVSNYAAGFKSTVLRDKFNQGIDNLKKTGRYKVIEQQYIDFPMNSAPL